VELCLLKRIKFNNFSKVTASLLGRRQLCIFANFVLAIYSLLKLTSGVPKVRPPLFALMFVVFSSAFAQTEPPQFMTVDGRLYDSSSPTDPLLDASVLLKIQVLNPAKTCILYEEEQTVSTLSSNGYFNVRVGSPTSDPKRSTDDSNNSMMQVFQNQNASIAGRNSSGSGVPCSYTPANGDSRFFRFIVTPSSTGVTSQLSPDMTIDSVPQALVAESLQGLSPDSFIQVNANTTQAKADNIFGAGYAALTNLISGTSSLYLQNTVNGTVIPNRATDPGSPTAGQIWYDSVANALKYYNGSTVQTLSTGVATDPSKLPLTGGAMTGNINMGGNQILGVGHITQNPQSTITLGTYTTAQQGTLTAALTAANKGATWFNSDTNKMMYWDGTVAQVVLDVATAGTVGDITAVTAGTGLTGGGVTGAVTLNVDIGTAATQLITNSSIPNCPANQSIQMSAGPIYTMSCVATTDSSKLPLAGGAMTGNITMGGNQILGAGHIVQANQSSITIGSYTTAQETPFVAALTAGNEGTLWFNSDTNELKYWDGAAAQVLTNIGSAGDMTAVNTNAGSGLSGGAASGAATLQIVVDNTGIEINGTNQLQLKDAGVVTAKLADNAVTAVKVANNAITSAKILDDEITNADINASAAIAWSKIDKTGANAGDVNAVARAGDTMTGALNIDNEQELRLSEADINGANYVALKAPAIVGSNVTFTLPAVDGANGQVLQTDGAGNLSFVAIASAPVSSVFGRTGAVVSANGDYTASQVTNVAAGGITGNTVQLAINELDTEKVAKAGDTMTGQLTMANNITLNAQNQVRYADSDSSNFVAIQSPATVTANYTLTLPDTAGTNGQVLSTNGSGVLSWITPSSVPANNSLDFTHFVDNMTLDASTDIATNGTNVLSITNDGNGNSFRVNDNGSGDTSPFVIDSAGNVGIGTTAPVAITHALGITEQLRLGYDVSNYFSAVVNSTGSLSLDLTGTSPRFNFQDAINIYGGGSTISHSVSSGTTLFGLDSVVTNTNGAAAAFAVGLRGVGIRQNNTPDAGVQLQAQGVVGEARYSGTGTLPSAAGVLGAVTNIGAGTITNAYSIYGTAPVASSGVITNSWAGGFNGNVWIAGNVGLGTTAPAAKLDVEGTIQIADGGELCAAPANAGMVKYVAGTLQYCNGSAWQTLGVSGAGLTTFNSQTGSTQTLAIGSSGLTPNWNSAANVHTLNIPLASGAGVTSGTITKTEYDAFNAKVDATRAINTVADSGLSGGGNLSADRSLSVNITGTTAETVVAGGDEILIWDISTGALRKMTRANFVLSETEVDTLVSNNGYALATNVVAKAGDTMTGALTMNAQNQVRFTDADSSNYVAIQSPATVTADYTLTLPTTAGTNGQVLSTNGSGVLSWITPSTVPANNSLDFTHFVDNMTLDASTDIATTGANVLSITNDATGNSFRVNDNGSGDTSPFVIDSTGRVGIGTTTPAGALHIGTGQVLAQDGTVSAPGYAFASDPDTGIITGGNAVQIVAGGSMRATFNHAYGHTLMLEGFPPRIGGNDDLVIDVDANGSGGGVFSVTRNNSAQELMRVDGATSNIGIGTTSPGTRLDVAGAITSRPSGIGTGQTGQLVMRELAATGTNTFAIRAPDDLTADRIWTLPDSNGSSGQVLQTNGSGLLSWTTPSTVPANNSLNFTHFVDSMTLDASTDIATTGANVLSITNDATGNSFRVNDNGSGDTSPFVIDSNGNVGIGTSTPSARLDINSMFTSDTKLLNASLINGDAGAVTNLTGLSAGAQRSIGPSTSVYGIDISATTATGATATDLIGGNFSILSSGTGAPTNVYGIKSDTLHSASAGTTTNAYGIYSSVQKGGLGTMTNAYGGYFTATRTGGTLTNGYGVYIADIGGTNQWGVYQAGSNDNNYFAGNVGIGTTAPGTLLDVAGAITSRPSGIGTGQTGQLVMRELAATGTNTFAIRAPDDLTADRIWTLPDSNGSSGQVLQTNGSGLLSWTTPSTVPANNSLNFTHFVDSMTLDASTDIATTGTNVLSITNDATGNSFRVNDNGSGDTSPFVIDGTGRVGVGTTAPTEKMEIFDAGTGAALKLTNLGNNNVKLIMDSNRSATDDYLGVIDGNWNGNRVARIIMRAGTDVGNKDSGYIQFRTRGASDPDAVERMTIDENGSVGIGTTAPSQKLDVEGTILSGPKGVAAGDGGAIRFEELATNGTNTVGFRAPNAITADVLWELPGADGTSGQLLQTNGAGVLSWVAPASAIATNSLDFDKFIDNMALDASTNITADGAEVLSITNTGTGNSFLVNDVSGDTSPFVIDADGNVGIGTTSTTNKFNVSDGNGYIRTGTLGLGGLRVKMDRTDASSALLVRDGADNDIFKIQTDGLVGVGTNAPLTLLDVAGAITSRPSGTGTGQTGQLIMRELATGGSDTVTIRAPDAIGTSFALTLPGTAGSSGQVLQTNGAGLLSWVSADSSVAANSLNFDKFSNSLVLDASTNISATGSEVLSITNSGTGNSFLVNDSAGDTSPFVIDANGNVGVGVAVPGAPMHVRGSTPQMIVQGSTGPSAMRLGGQPDNTAVVEVYRTGPSDITAATPTNYERLTFGFNQYEPTGANAFIGTEKNGTGVDRALLLTMGSSEIMRLHTNSNVGIGSTTPTQKLDVVGNIRATGSVIGGAATDADPLSALTVDFTNTNTIRATDVAGPCGTLNVTNVTTGGYYTVTMLNANATCTAIQLNGSTANVKLPVGYGGGGATVNGVVYTFLFDGLTLWVTFVPY
jgi:trimeric autotransporter adhesin